MMDKRVLVLFPDTNFFIQCRSARTIAWESLGSWEEIHLILCRPVQREIDGLKSRGNERLGRRAREASALIREIVMSGATHLLIRDASPRVRVSLDTRSRPDPLLDPELNYEYPDDQIVGIVAAFVRVHPDDEVRLLTQDTGVMASAKAVGVPFLSAPDNWLLPPETTEGDKRIAALEREVSALKQLGPSFNIECIGLDGNPVSTLDLELVRYSALKPDQLAFLLSRLTDRLPKKVIDTEPQDGGLLHGVLGLGEWVPPSQEVIAKYDVDYAAWLDECVKLLRDCHIFANLHRVPTQFRFSAQNVGSRPAKDALVTIHAQGSFLVGPEPDGDDSHSQAMQMPMPPTAPTGEWRSLMSTLDILNTYRGFDSTPVFREPPLLGFPMVRAGRDPNEFFWKPERPESPQPLMTLECEQWRHGIAVEAFVGRLYLIDEDSGAARGVLTCSVHAENLSTPAALTVPVQITVKSVSVVERASAAVEQLINRVFVLANAKRQRSR